jgi:hypothetical protein
MYFTLREGAAQLYAALRGGNIAHIIELKYTSDDDILDYAGNILMHNAELEVRKLPSQKWEPFDRTLLSQMRACGGATGLRYVGDRIPHFSEVRMLPQDLTAAINRIVAKSDIVGDTIPTDKNTA